MTIEEHAKTPELAEEVNDDADSERDERGSEPPSEHGEAEPEPGEDGGPMGNPGQDEEALEHRQEEASEG